MGKRPSIYMLEPFLYVLASVWFVLHCVFYAVKQTKLEKRILYLEETDLDDIVRCLGDILCLRLNNN